MGTPSAAPRTRMRHEGTMRCAERHLVGWVAVNSSAHGRRVIRRHGRTAAAIIGGTSQSAKGCWAREQQAAARRTPFEVVARAVLARWKKKFFMVWRVV